MKKQRDMKGFSGLVAELNASTKTDLSPFDGGVLDLVHL